jgi:hypothetical protein
MRCIGRLMMGVLCCASAGGLDAATGDEALDAYAYRLELRTSADAFQRLVMPAAVYEHVAHADLRDLRVFNGAGEVVPFAFVPAVPSTPLVERRALVVYPVRVDEGIANANDVTLSLRASGGTMSLDVRTRDGRSVAGSRVAGYVIDASALDVPIGALVVTAGAADLNTRASIEASDDLASWRRVATAAPLLRLQMDGRTLLRDRVDLPAVHARYFRLTTDAPLPEPVTVEAQIGVHAAPPALPTRELEGTYAQAGAFEYDAQGPFDAAQVDLRLAAPNTVAPARVLGRADPNMPWRPVADAVFYRLGEPSREVRNPPVRVAGAAWRYWRVELDPRSGVTSASPPMLLVGWQPAEIVFASRGPAPFQLAYGRRDANPGALPIAILVPGFDARRGLGPDAAIATPAGAPQVGSRTALGLPVDFRRIALWGVLIVTVLVLGGLGVRLLREPPPPRDAG